MPLKQQLSTGKNTEFLWVVALLSFEWWKKQAFLSAGEEWS
jgi:hypothetical protein